MLLSHTSSGPETRGSNKKKDVGTHLCNAIHPSNLPESKAHTAESFKQSSLKKLFPSVEKSHKHISISFILIHNATMIAFSLQKAVKDNKAKKCSNPQVTIADNQYRQAGTANPMSQQPSQPPDGVRPYQTKSELPDDYARNLLINPRRLNHIRGSRGRLLTANRDIRRNL